MNPSEIIYNLLLDSFGWVTEELKFEITRGIYVDVDLNFWAQTTFYKSYKMLIKA